MEVKFKFGLGMVVREKITGFEGVVMSQCKYISGCVQYGVLSQKLTAEGKTADWIYYDENRLQYTGTVLHLDEGEGEEEELADTPIGGEDVRVSHDSSAPKCS